jgi:hypothetical protein
MQVFVAAACALAGDDVVTVVERLMNEFADGMAIPEDPPEPKTPRRRTTP